MSNLNPIFIVCTGRSGSTLLRYILDTHEMIEAPQELHLGPMIKEMLRVNTLLYENKIPEDKDVASFVTSKVRTDVDQIIRASISKEIWCDKSVSSIDFLDEIMTVFPNARYIYLYRDCLDFVHSALEVSKYGFQGFWFEDFILRNPENIVDGLVNFWCMQTEKRINLQNESKYAIYPIKYEDIVHSPESTLKLLFDFLELDFDKGILDRLFVKFRPGKGDLKVQSSGKIHKNTGKGKYIPLKQIKEDTFIRMNKILSQIGYNTVDRNINFIVDGVTESNDLHDYSIDKVSDYFQTLLDEEIPNSEIRTDKIFFDIPGVKSSPWMIDFEERKMIKGKKANGLDDLFLKVRIDSLIKMVDQNLNISMAYRNGFLETNASYQKLNEIGKYLFG